MSSSIVAQVSSEQSGCDRNGQKHRVLLSGIDTLITTCGGSSAVSRWYLDQCSEWEQIQRYVADTGNEQVVQVGKYYFQMNPYGKSTYKFQLYNPEVGYIQVYNPHKWLSNADKKQQVRLHLYSKFLHSHSQSSILREMKDIFSCFFEDISTAVIQVSRVDLHADISHSRMLTFEEVDSSISRARRRQKHFGEVNDFSQEDLELLRKFQGASDSRDENYYKSPSKLIDTELLESTRGVIDKLLNIIDSQGVNNLSSTIHKRDLETAYFGKIGNDIWGKIYDKTKETKTARDLDTPELWKSNGWNGEGTVIRIEFSMRRDFLKELNSGLYVDLENLFSGMSSIWNYLTNNWLRLVEEVKHNNLQTSVITEFWRVVSSAFEVDIQHTITRVKNYSGKIKQLYAQSLGCINQAISIAMNADTDSLSMTAILKRLQNDVIEEYENGGHSNRRKILGFSSPI